MQARFCDAFSSVAVIIYRLTWRPVLPLDTTHELSALIFRLFFFNFLFFGYLIFGFYLVPDFVDDCCGFSF